MNKKILAVMTWFGASIFASECHAVKGQNRLDKLAKRARHAKENGQRAKALRKWGQIENLYENEVFFRAESKPQKKTKRDKLIERLRNNTKSPPCDPEYLRIVQAHLFRTIQKDVDDQYR